MLAAVFAAFVGLAAAQSQCWSCSAPSYSKCMDNCLLNQFNEGACATQAGCIWQFDTFPVGCSFGDPNITEACAEATNSTGCEALPNCTWQTTYCKRMHYCESNNGTTCDHIDNCSDQGPHCYDATYCYEATDYCDASTKQAECTATSGCFWYEIAVLHPPGNNVNVSKCSPCFQPDSENNTFSQFQSRVGYSCYFPTGSLANYTSATAASTGCSGGQTPAWEGAVCFQAPTTGAPTTSAPTPTPTTLAPSAGCTRAPTDSNKVSGAVARGAVGLMGVTLLGTFLLA